MIHTEMFHKMFTALITGLWDHDQCVDKVLSVSALACTVTVVTVNTYNLVHALQDETIVLCRTRCIRLCSGEVVYFFIRLYGSKNVQASKEPYVPELNQQARDYRS